MKKKLVINVVTYNSARYLPDFFDSLNAQTFRDWSLMVIDNNSSDNSVALVKEYAPYASISVQSSNLGFSKAHNLLIGWSKSDFVVVVNPDMVLEPECLERLYEALMAHPRAASVGPKLLYWNAGQNAKENIIDTCGLELCSNYRVRDRFQGLPDTNIASGSVFGNSGSFVVFRRAALEATKIPKQRRSSEQFEYFDEDYFMYKEDVDLAWRMLIAGFSHYFVAEAVAYHQRAVSQRNSTWRERRARRAVNRYSYRNHILTIYKNQYWTLTLRLFFPIMLHEIQKFFYLALLDGSSIKGLRDAIFLYPSMRRKRKYLSSHRRLPEVDFEQFIVR